jgi:predicted acyl esterase
LKDIPNDWKDTPRVRWTSLNFGDLPAISGIKYADFPVPETEYRVLHLSAATENSSDGALSLDPPRSASRFEYDSENGSSFAGFTYKFPQKSRLIGIPKVYLYMSCKDRDDMNVFIQLRKLDKDGKPLMHLCFPIDRTPYKSISEIPIREQSSLNMHLGSVGILRASHRKIDRSKSWHENAPFHPHDEEWKIAPGTVVELEIGIWAMGNDFDEGESLRMQVSGQFPNISEYKAFSEERPEHERNKGAHVIHCEPGTPSRLVLPFLPI